MHFVGILFKFITICSGTCISQACFLNLVVRIRANWNINANFIIQMSKINVEFTVRLRSHRSRLFGYTVYVFEGTRILAIKHYDLLIPGHIGGHYSKSSYRRV